MNEEPTEDYPQKPINYRKLWKMYSYLFTKRKIIAYVMLLALYMYILFVVKLAYLRSKRQDTIDKLALKNEKLINHIHRMDHQLIQRLTQLDDYFKD